MRASSPDGTPAMGSLGKRLYQLLREAGAEQAPEVAGAPAGTLVWLCRPLLRACKQL